MRTAQQEYSWKLNFGEIAQIWRGGCIIRSVFLGKIKEAFDKTGDNDRATAEGLSATASVITFAAVIMVLVFGVFAFARVLAYYCRERKVLSLPEAVRKMTSMPAGALLGATA